MPSYIASLGCVLVVGLGADADRPYDVNKDWPTNKPQIVTAVHKQDLYVAWQTWGARNPSDKIGVAKVGSAKLGDGQWSAVREVASLGTLAGFAVDDAGTDYVLTALAESFPTTPKDRFVTDIHEQWRKNVLTLYRGGQATDLNADRFTGLPFYGVTDSGSGRLAVGGTQLAAVFSRRRYTPRDKLIHQEANALIVDRNLAMVQLRAGNTVSHSFDQRLIFDGVDFVALHQADTYPFTGLIVERLRSNSGKQAPLTHFLAYSCPTFGNAVFFELGGLAAEPDGYPILFTTTRNTDTVVSKNVGAMHNTAWDLAMVYVVRDFQTKANRSRPYDITGSGGLAKGYALDQEFTVNNNTWNPKTSRYDKEEPRIIGRRVLWLTECDKTTRATRAKLVKLKDGQYLALWEEHIMAGPRWKYATTRAMILTSAGGIGNKAITKGRQVELKGVRLHQGDDAVALTIGGAAHAVWVTAGANANQLAVQTLDADLMHKTYMLKLP